MAPRHQVHTVAQRAKSYWTFNQLAARAGMRTLAHRAQRNPRLAAWSLPYEGIVEMMTLGTPQGEIHSADEIRRPLERITLITQPTSAVRQPVTTACFGGEWVTTAASAHERVILYLHGGGYVSGSPTTHAPITGRLAKEAQARIFALDYRLAPEHPFPAQIEDAWAAYWWLITEQGVKPAQITVAGDSAGGGLTIALLLALRDAGVPLPSGAICLSPWFDLTLSSATLATNAPTDYLNFDVLHASAQMYAHGCDLRHPLISPLYADLAGLPPLLIQAGSAEMLLDDSRRFALRAREAGVNVQLEVWDHMVHVWHFTWLLEPKARQAVTQIGDFVRRHTPIPGDIHG